MRLSNDTTTIGIIFSVYNLEVLTMTLQILQIFFISFLAFSPLTDLNKKFPDAQLKTLEGKEVSLSEYIGKGKPVVVSFWATWCKPCKQELDNIAEVYPDWQEKYGVEILAINTDNSRSLRKVPGLVKTKGWDYTILSDSKQSMMNLLGFQAIPQTFLLDGEGNIVYAHSGYAEGDEDELEEKIAALK